MTNVHYSKLNRFNDNLTDNLSVKKRYIICVCCHWIYTKPTKYNWWIFNPIFQMFSTQDHWLSGNNNRSQTLNSQIFLSFMNYLLNLLINESYNLILICTFHNSHFCWIIWSRFVRGKNITEIFWSGGRSSEFQNV
jgi:hypothetical protein